MASAIWKGFLSFGLVSIPVHLSAAAREERISFHQLHDVCHTRIKQPLFCPTCNRMVERSEIVKGYEYAKDQYLLFSEKELQDIQPDSARTMEILAFVKLAEIDPLYFDSSYYVAPEEGGAKGYELLLEAMLQSGYAAIAKITMHNRENIVTLRAREGGLVMHTMFYSNEIRAAEGAPAEKPEVREAERSLAKQLIEALAAPFQPENYHDAYQQSLQQLIEAKSHGQSIAAVPHSKGAPVIDLMEALKKSLSQRPVPVEKLPMRVEPKRAELRRVGEAKKSRRTG